MKLLCNFMGNANFFVTIHDHVTVCNESFTIGKSALPDVYVQCLRASVYVYIR